MTGEWVGLWQQHGFATTNPNGVFYALAWATFTGRILGPDGNWYTGTVNILVHNVFKFAPNGTVLDYWVNETIEGGGTGELANLRGHGTEDLDGNGTWSLHFEP